MANNLKPWNPKIKFIDNSEITYSNYITKSKRSKRQSINKRESVTTIDSTKIYLYQNKLNELRDIDRKCYVMTVGHCKRVLFHKFCHNVKNDIHILKNMLDLYKLDNLGFSWISSFIVDKTNAILRENHHANYLSFIEDEDEERGDPLDNANTKSSKYANIDSRYLNFRQSFLRRSSTQEDLGIIHDKRNIKNIPASKSPSPATPRKNPSPDASSKLPKNTKYMRRNSSIAFGAVSGLFRSNVIKNKPPLEKQKTNPRFQSRKNSTTFPASNPSSPTNSKRSLPQLYKSNSFTKLDRVKGRVNSSSPSIEEIIEEEDIPKADAHQISFALRPIEVIDDDGGNPERENINININSKIDITETENLSPVTVLKSGFSSPSNINSNSNSNSNTDSSFSSSVSSISISKQMKDNLEGDLEREDSLTIIPGRELASTELVEIKEDEEHSILIQEVRPNSRRSNLNTLNTEINIITTNKDEKLEVTEGSKNTRNSDAQPNTRNSNINRESTNNHSNTSTNIRRSSAYLSPLARNIRRIYEDSMAHNRRTMDELVEEKHKVEDHTNEFLEQNIIKKSANYEGILSESLRQGVKDTKININNNTNTNTNNISHLLLTSGGSSKYRHNDFSLTSAELHQHLGSRKCKTNFMNYSSSPVKHNTGKAAPRTGLSKPGTGLIYIGENENNSKTPGKLIKGILANNNNKHITQEDAGINSKYTNTNTNTNITIEGATSNSHRNILQQDPLSNLTEILRIYSTRNSKNSLRDSMGRTGGWSFGINRSNLTGGGGHHHTRSTSMLEHFSWVAIRKSSARVTGNININNNNNNMESSHTQRPSNLNIYSKCPTWLGRGQLIPTLNRKHSHPLNLNLSKERGGTLKNAENIYTPGKIFRKFESRNSKQYTGTRSEYQNNYNYNTNNNNIIYPSPPTTTIKNKKVSGQLLREKIEKWKRIEKGKSINLYNNEGARYFSQRNKNEKPFPVTKVAVTNRISLFHKFGAPKKGSMDSNIYKSDDSSQYTNDLITSKPADEIIEMKTVSIIPDIMHKKSISQSITETQIIIPSENKKERKNYKLTRTNQTSPPSQKTIKISRNSEERKTLISPEYLQLFPNNKRVILSNREQKLPAEVLSKLPILDGGSLTRMSYLGKFNGGEATVPNLVKYIDAQLVMDSKGKAKAWNNVDVEYSPMKISKEKDVGCNILIVTTPTIKLRKKYKRKSKWKIE